MKPKHSVNRLFVSILVLGALLLSAFTVQAAAANPASKSSALSNFPAQIFEKINAAFSKDRGLEQGSSAQVKSSSNDQSGENEGSETENGSEEQNEMENEHEITGTVTAVSSTSWTIGTTQVLIDKATEIGAGLGMGSVVKVEYSTQSDGSFLATEIKAFEQNSDENENSGNKSDDNQENETEDNHGNKPAGSPVEFTGQLTAINGDSWTINGMTVLISTSTKVHGDPKVGSMVRVVGLLETGGSVQARQVIPTNPEGDNGVGSDSSHNGDHGGDHSGSGD